MSDSAATVDSDRPGVAFDARTARATQTPMPLRAHHVIPRSTALRRPAATVADVPFDDLVFELAAGVADAQTALDEHTAETATSLSETDVDVVPSMTRTIEPDGSVTTSTAPAERRSLLELGFTPSHYRFSEATIEVEADVSVTERETEEREADGDAGATGSRTGLRAGTQSVIDRRKFDRTAGANARLVATLEPTPLPVRTAPPAADDADRGDRAD